jgi:kynurenine aminotransferase
VSPSIFQEAAAVGYEGAEKRGFWRQAIEEMAGKMKSFCEVWNELGIPVSHFRNGHQVKSVAREIF